MVPSNCNIIFFKAESLHGWCSCHKLPLVEICSLNLHWNCRGKYAKKHEYLAVASSVPAKAPTTNDAIGQELEKEEEEGKLSRSPSSVMLLTEESVCD